MARACWWSAGSRAESARNRWNCGPGWRHLAPSDLLRRWFDERPRQWQLFRRRYLAELCTEEAAAALGMLHELAASEPCMTLLTIAGEPERSHAAILRDLLQGVRKPPSTTGPARAAAGGRIRAPRPQ